MDRGDAVLALLCFPSLPVFDCTLPQCPEARRLQHFEDALRNLRPLLGILAGDMIAVLEAQVFVHWPCFADLDIAIEKLHHCGKKVVEALEDECESTWTKELLLACVRSVVETKIPALQRGLDQLREIMASICQHDALFGFSSDVAHLATPLVTQQVQSWKNLRAACELPPTLSLHEQRKHSKHLDQLFQVQRRHYTSIALGLENAPLVVGVDFLTDSAYLPLINLASTQQILGSSTTEVWSAYLSQRTPHELDCMLALAQALAAAASLSSVTADSHDQFLIYKSLALQFANLVLALSADPSRTRFFWNSAEALHVLNEIVAAKGMEIAAQMHALLNGFS